MKQKVNRCLDLSSLPLQHLLNATCIRVVPKALSQDRSPIVLDTVQAYGKR